MSSTSTITYLLLVTLVCCLSTNGMTSHGATDSSPFPSSSHSLRMDVHVLGDGIVNIRCVQNTTVVPSCGVTVIILRLSNNGGKEVAGVLGEGTIRYGNMAKDNVEAAGYIDQCAGNSFLSTNITYSTEYEDSGLYACAVEFLDETGHLKEIVVPRHVTIEENKNGGTNSDATNSLMFDKVSKLESLLMEQRNEISALKQEVAAVQDELRSQRSETMHWRSEVQILEDKVQTQQSQLASQETTIDGVKSSFDVYARMEGLMFAFGANYNSQDEVRSWHPLIFRDVYLNEGDAYNSTTATFLAPWSGFYVFHLVVLTRFNGDKVTVSLNKNGEPQAYLYAEDPTRTSQSAIGLCLFLNDGDEVTPIVGHIDKGNVIEGGKRSFFNGYLIKL